MSKRQKMHDSHAMSRTRELPGPQGRPLLGTITPFIGKDLLHAFGGLIAEYGPLFGVHLPYRHRLVMVAHPDGVEQLLRSGRKNNEVLRLYPPAWTVARNAGELHANPLKGR